MQAMITGTVDGRTTLKLPRTDMNTILTLFHRCQRIKAAYAGQPGRDRNINCNGLYFRRAKPAGLWLLCKLRYTLEPGSDYPKVWAHRSHQQLQWKILWLIFGRINLDKYLELKGRVETRMRASIMTATGDDNPLDPEEQGDLEYRKAQRERLQNEVVDIEENAERCFYYGFRVKWIPAWSARIC